MNKQELENQIRKKKSFLCIGLDTDLELIPKHLLEEEDPIFAFNKAIIDATHEYCVAYKPNFAFYESQGTKGWMALEKTVQYLNQHYPELFTIADAKRGDIGNTSKMYAQAVFQHLNFDSITVAPYMGKDSVTPFMQFEDKWVILLALTSNPGAFDFQTLKADQKNIYEHVISVSKQWGSEENMMYVVGATKAEMLAQIRTIIPNHFLLVPGVGAQGGSLAEVVKFGMNKNIGLLVNSSRAIIYNSSDYDFSQKAKKAAKDVQIEMSTLMESYNS